MISCDTYSLTGSYLARALVTKKPWVVSGVQENMFLCLVAQVDRAQLSCMVYKIKKPLNIPEVPVSFVLVD